MPDTRTETRTYWAVCEAWGADGNKRWSHRSALLETEEEGQRKLRWLRRWHPHAFLVKTITTVVRDTVHTPPQLRVV